MIEHEQVPGDRACDLNGRRTENGRGPERIHPNFLFRAEADAIADAINEAEARRADAQREGGRE